MCRFYEWIQPQLPTLESVQTLRSAGIWIGMPNAIAVGVGAHRESLIFRPEPRAGPASAD
ncbi:MAG: hypothetical protein QOI31_2542 [Solirubrobacterales bacterium]|nr:hypothetical protein [Solirubrobacterales bacterium]